MQVAINGERPWMDTDCPEPLRKLITKCWHQDPHMRPSPAEIMRLTDFMIQEELRRWEQLQHHSSGLAAGGRLPSAAWGFAPGTCPPGRAMSVPAPGPAVESLAGTGAAAVAPSTAGGATQASRPSSPEAPAATGFGVTSSEAVMVTAAGWDTSDSLAVTAATAATRRAQR
jgi:hypothetical protein